MIYFLDHSHLSLYLFLAASYLFLDTKLKNSSFKVQNRILFRAYLVNCIFKFSDNLSYIVFELQPYQLIGYFLPFICDLCLFFIPFLIIKSEKRKRSLFIEKYMLYYVVINFLAVLNIMVYSTSDFNWTITKDSNGIDFIRAFTTIDDNGYGLTHYTVILSHGSYLVLSILLLKRFHTLNSKPLDNAGKSIILFLSLYTILHFQSILINYGKTTFMKNLTTGGKMSFGQGGFNYSYTTNVDQVFVSLMTNAFGNSAKEIFNSINKTPIIHAYFVNFALYLVFIIIPSLLINYFVYKYQKIKNNNNTFYKNYFDTTAQIYY